MLAPSTTLLETIEFPKIPAHVERPKKLVLRFAEIGDVPVVYRYLREQKQATGAIDEAVERGRLVIFYNPDKKEICGVAYARKVARKVKIETPVLSLPWVALSQIMIAALISNELNRASEIEFETQKDQIAFLKTPLDARDYLERATNFERIISGTCGMKLHLSPALEEIKQIDMIRKSLRQRCG